jgi:hypothetical protein
LMGARKNLPAGDSNPRNVPNSRIVSPS